MKPYLFIPLCYLAFGFAWILLTDHYYASKIHDVEVLTAYQNIKGYLFVGLSGLLLYFLTRWAYREMKRKDEATMQVFKRTVAGAHHILRNYLNQMQVVTLEAEEYRDFNRETLATAKEISREAEVELEHLAKLEEVSPEQVDSVIYRKLN